MASVAESEDVGSSKIKSFGFRAIARAIAISWRLATPKSDTLVFTSIERFIVLAIALAPSFNNFLLTKNPKYYFDAEAIAEPARRRTDVWSINTASCKEAHFAVFPTKIPEMCIKAGTKEGDVVLDPFMGSGTTAYVAQRLGRKWVGVELNPKYAQIIKNKVAQRELF